MRIFIYVQHLQGIGHVIRTDRIAAALVAAGHHVTVVRGGMPIPARNDTAADVVQLPPLRASSTSYRELLRADGTIADDAFKADRRDRLIAAYDAARPDVVMTEAFPFDRPQMHFELIPLLDHARARSHRPLIVSSIRDILQRKAKPERDADALAILRQYFDHVLVHGDPKLATLGETFRHADEISAITSYTGIVAPPPLPASGNGTGTSPTETSKADTFDVVLSTGGGATDGHRVLEAAIAAKPLSPLSGARWLALRGPNLGTDRDEALQRLAERNDVTLAPFATNFLERLSQADVSISQAGYNTVADILRARCRAVLCPYAGIRQNEQTERARRLADRNLAAVAEWETLSPETIADAIRAALEGTPAHHEIDLDGAAATAAQLERLSREAA